VNRALAALLTVLLVGWQLRAPAGEPPRAGAAAAPAAAAAAGRSGPPEPFGGGEKAFQKARALLEESYAEPVDAGELWRGAVEGMLARAGGRRWDQLLSPSEYAQMRSDLKGEVTGLGIEIKFDAPSGLIAVERVLLGSGAEQAGLRAGDQILRVDGRSFRGLAYGDVLQALRGRSGTRVELRVLRDDQVLSRTVRRSALPIEAVSALALPRGIALITIRSFSERTAGELRAALAKTRQARALILDLRGNPGGLLDGTLACAGLLLPAGTRVASLVGRGKEKPLLAAAGADGVSPDASAQRPIVILVDGKTASSAELLASALRTARGARLVGKRTQGKWNVQRLEELDNGYVVRLTIGVLRAASGELPDGIGIAPDVPVEMAAEAVDPARRLVDPAQRIKMDAQLQTALALL
jgi:carboxyl-terminal processing protease